MSRQENKDLVTRAFWFLSGNKLDLFFNILAPGYVVHYPQGDLNRRRICRGDFNLAQVKAYETLFFALFPDASATIFRNGRRGRQGGHSSALDSDT